MRILYYNWVPLHDRNYGGGVNVYLRNILYGFSSFYPDVELYYLCSGRYCDISDRRIRHEPIESEFGDICKAFAMINSPVFSPAYLSFCRIPTVLEEDALSVAFRKFLEDNGPFDVVHFHNVEGLSIACLDVKKYFPSAKFIYSLHNYHIFCPQVNLWREESSKCVMESTGAHCIPCMITHVPAEKLMEKMSMSYALLKNYSDELAEAFKKRGKQLDEAYAEDEKMPMDADSVAILSRALENYREKFVQTLNKNIDIFLAVSNRTGEIAARMGILQNKIVTSYIGTDIKRQKTETVAEDNFLSIIYMGYQRRDKGFFFLIDSLNTLREEIAQRINLTIAAKKSDIPWNLNIRNFHSFHYIDGYKRDEIPKILNDKDLGIVPSLWEDNLPQTALEMVAFGVPILCSDSGGSRELGGDDRFVFKTGDAVSLTSKLEYFADDPKQTVEYFKKSRDKMDIKTHLSELMKLYKGA